MWDCTLGYTQGLSHHLMHRTFVQEKTALRFLLQRLDTQIIRIHIQISNTHTFIRTCIHRHSDMHACAFLFATHTPANKHFQMYMRYTFMDVYTVNTHIHVCIQMAKMFTDIYIYIYIYMYIHILYTYTCIYIKVAKTCPWCLLVYAQLYMFSRSSYRQYWCRTIYVYVYISIGINIHIHTYWK